MTLSRDHSKDDSDLNNSSMAQTVEPPNPVATDKTVGRRPWFGVFVHSSDAGIHVTPST